MIFHLLPAADAAIAQRTGIYHPASLDRDGFIHFSTASQLLKTASIFYANRGDMVIFCVDESSTDCVRFEAVSDRADDLFPHYYGELPMDAVLKTVRLPLNASGAFVFPEELSALADENEGCHA